MKYIIHSLLVIGLFASCEMLNAFGGGGAKTTGGGGKSAPVDPSKSKSSSSSTPASGNTAPAPTSTSAPVEAWTPAGTFTIASTTPNSDGSYPVKTADGKTGNLKIGDSTQPCKVDGAALGAVGLTGSIGSFTAA